MFQISNLDSRSIEIIKDKLYWISDKNPPKNQPNAFFFNIDSDLVYEPFSSDFGPLDLGKTYRFISELQKLLQEPSYLRSKFYHHTSLDTAKRANAACLMGAFQIITLGRTAEEAWEPFARVQPPLEEYKDASYTASGYRCSILDCLRGLEYAIKLRWFDVKSFNLRDYEYYEKVENGDLNWIIPGKFVAFSGPLDAPRDPEGFRRFTPDDYIPIFKKFGVTMVIRLNNKQYDETRFKKSGIKHTDLFFPDGSCPNDDIIAEFLRICEQEKGAVAVHCKAGLGRTGTLIAAYAMKHYKFLGPDFIGYIRLCRPGSILGPQQQYLVDKQQFFHNRCDASPLYRSVAHLVNSFHSRREGLMEEDIDNLRISKKTMEMSPMDKRIAKYGDHGQASRLLEAKYKVRPSVESPAEHFSAARESLNTRESQNERMSYNERVSQNERTSVNERNSYNERTSYNERPSQNGRNSNTGRDSCNERNSYNERTSYNERNERNSITRSSINGTPARSSSRNQMRNSGYAAVGAGSPWK